MPNHVHALTEILEPHTLPSVLHSWKGFTSREINSILNRTGTLWQKGYFDRLIRDWPHFLNVVRYIRRNPVKARLGPNDYLSGESELAARFE
jgi:putative transposase